MASYLRTTSAGGGNNYLRTTAAGSASLSTPTFSAITTSTATMSVTTDTAGGTLYIIVTPISGTPTAAQIKAGQSSTGAAALYATSATATSGANVFSGVTGLVSGTVYYGWAIQNNGVDSNTVTNNFTSAAGLTLTNVNTTNIIVSGSTGNVANGTNLGSVVSGTLNYSTFSSAISSVVAASTTVTFTVPTITSTTSLPFTDANHTAIFLRVTDGTNNAQINLASVGGMAVPAGFTVYPISAATGQYGTDSAYHNVPSAPANNDQSLWPVTGTNGWTITPELSGANATGRFSVSGGTGGTTTFTIFYRVETTGVWYSTAVTYNFNVSANVSVIGVGATSAINGPVPTTGTNIAITGVSAATFIAGPVVSAVGSAIIAVPSVVVSSAVAAPTVIIGAQIIPISVAAASAVSAPTVVITGGVSSGTTTFRPTILELLEEAWERATGGQELRTGYQLRTARRSFNFLTIDWQNRGYNFWTLREGSYTINAGQQGLYLPLDTMDLSDATVSVGGVDRTLQRITMPDYAQIPTKTTQGPPAQMQVHRTVDQILVKLWPVPDATYTVHTYELRRIQDAGTGATVADIPYRFLPAIVAGLAYFIASKIGGDAYQRVPMLQAQYNDAFESAADEDRDKGSLFIAPRRVH